MNLLLASDVHSKNSFALAVSHPCHKLLVNDVHPVQPSTISMRPLLMPMGLPCVTSYNIHSLFSMTHSCRDKTMISNRKRVNPPILYFIRLKWPLLPSTCCTAEMVGVQNNANFRCSMVTTFCQTPLFL